MIEVVGNALVKAVQLSLLLLLKMGVSTNWLQQAGGERGVDALKELKENVSERELGKVAFWRGCKELGR